MTSTTSRVLKNSFSIYSAKAINLVISFFIFIHIANYLGDAEFGRLSIAITFVATFDIIANFGINQIVVRELASKRFPVESMLGAGVLLKLISSLSALLLSIIAVSLMNYAIETMLAAWIISLNLIFSSKLSSTRTICEAPFQANLKMHFPMLYNLLDNVLFAAAIIIATWKGSPSLLDIAIIYTVCNVPGALLLLTHFLRSYKFSMSKPVAVLKYLVPEAVPIALYLLFSILSTKVDIILLSRLKTDADVGIYSAATRLVYPLLFFSTSFTLSIFPLLSQYYRKDLERFYYIFNSGLKIIILLAVFLTIPLSFSADKIISTLYIDSYASAAGAFRVLILALGLSFLNFYFVDLFISMRRQKMNTVILAIALFINIVLNVLLIPRYGFLGAGYVRLATALVVFAIFCTVLYKDMKNHIVLDVRLFWLAIVYVAVQFFVGDLNIFIIAAIDLFVFTAFLFIFRVVTDEELALLKELFRSKP